jgi:hypothetical protein
MIRDPRSGKKSSRIPDLDPWGKNALDPGSGSATLQQCLMVDSSCITCVLLLCIVMFRCIEVQPVILEVLYLSESVF